MPDPPLSIPVPFNRPRKAAFCNPNGRVLKGRIPQIETPHYAKSRILQIETPHFQKPHFARRNGVKSKWCLPLSYACRMVLHITIIVCTESNRASESLETFSNCVLGLFPQFFFSSINLMDFCCCCCCAQKCYKSYMWYAQASRS